MWKNEDKFDFQNEKKHNELQNDIFDSSHFKKKLSVKSLSRTKTKISDPVKGTVEYVVNFSSEYLGNVLTNFRIILDLGCSVKNLFNLHNFLKKVFLFDGDNLIESFDFEKIYIFHRMFPHLNIIQEFNFEKINFHQTHGYAGHRYIIRVPFFFNKNVCFPLVLNKKEDQFRIQFSIDSAKYTLLQSAYRCDFQKISNEENRLFKIEKYRHLFPIVKCFKENLNILKKQENILEFQIFLNGYGKQFVNAFCFKMSTDYFDKISIYCEENIIVSTSAELLRMDNKMFKAEDDYFFVWEFCLDAFNIDSLNFGVDFGIYKNLKVVVEFPKHLENEKLNNTVELFTFCPDRLKRRGNSNFEYLFTRE